MLVVLPRELEVKNAQEEEIDACQAISNWGAERERKMAIIGYRFLAWVVSFSMFKNPVSVHKPSTSRVLTQVARDIKRFLTFLLSIPFLHHIPFL